MNAEWQSPSRASPLPLLGMSTTGLSASRMAMGSPAKTEEPRQSSPFGSPRLNSPSSGSAACPAEDIWRVRKRVLGGPPLTPIEETLRQRRGLQASMSTPLLSLGKEDAWWALTKADASGNSPLPQAKGTRSLVNGASTRSAASGLLPNKGRLQHPLPADVVVRIKDRGWTTKGGVSMSVWVQQAVQARRLGASNADRWLHDRLRLLAFLEQEGVPQGLTAFRTGLSWRCGSLDRGFEQLSASASGGRCPLSLLELAGVLALFGLDVPALCGHNEFEALRRLDADGDKRLGFLDLLNGGSGHDSVKSSSTPAIVADVHAAVCEKASVGDSGGAPSAEVMAVADKWILIMKFVALSAWFSLPVTLRLRQRGKSSSRDHEATRSVSPPPSSSVMTGAAAIMLAATERDGGSTLRAGEGGRLARQQVLDPVRQQWAPSKGDFEVIQAALRQEFTACATGQNSGEPLMSRVDFFRFVGEMPLPPVVTGGDRDELSEAKLTQSEAGCLFDEVVDLQASNFGSQLKGLHFESFRIVLYKVAIALGVNFRYLLNDALEAGLTQSA